MHLNNIVIPQAFNLSRLVWTKSVRSRYDMYNTFNGHDAVKDQVKLYYPEICSLALGKEKVMSF